jgi:hypothetical protein
MAMDRGRLDLACRVRRGLLGTDSSSRKRMWKDWNFVSNSRANRRGPVMCRRRVVGFVPYGTAMDRVVGDDKVRSCSALTSRGGLDMPGLEWTSDSRGRIVTYRRDLSGRSRLAGKLSRLVGR